MIKRLFKTLVALGLVLALALGNGSAALAARSGGRMGGGSFRMPSRSYGAPSRTYRAPSGGYAGGGIGFPFLLPFFGFGGFGGLFGLFVVLAIANVIVRGLSGFGQAREEARANQVGIAQVQIGLLAEARSLQDDLNRIGQNADTSTSAGLAQLLQETTLSLLRHPEYWAYASSQTIMTDFGIAEDRFNQLALAERSKVDVETFYNVNAQRSNPVQPESLPAASTIEASNAADQSASLATSMKQYIVVTLLVGAQGKLDLPQVRSTDDLRRALSQIGAVGSDRLMKVEVLWTPQSASDSLSADDLVAYYPDLALI